MPDFINYLQHRVEETKRKLQEVNDRIQQATVERETLGADLQGYERTLSAEMRGQGLAVPVTVHQESLPLNGSPNGGIGNKAEFTRQFVRQHAESGVTPADIFKGFQDAGVPINKAYIYALVQRLQKQTAIRSRRGKWYPVPESEQAVIGTAEKALP